MSFLNALKDAQSVTIRQKTELAELLGFETRNKYVIESEHGMPIGFAAEQNKGIFGFLFRQFLGHWRRFDIHFFDQQRQLVMKGTHPFRFVFQRLEVTAADGTYLGAAQQRFALISKKFDLESADGRVIMSVHSPFWRLWTFPFKRNGREVAVVEKRWGGLLAEALTDKDKFRVRFSDPALSDEERLLLVAAGLFIDLQYFEAKAN